MWDNPPPPFKENNTVFQSAPPLPTICMTFPVYQSYSYYDFDFENDFQ